MAVDIYVFIMPECCGVAPYFSSSAISLDCCIWVYIHIHGREKKEISPPLVLSESLKTASAHYDTVIDKQMFQSWV